MKKIGEIISQREVKKSGASSERAELIGKFTDELNKDRNGRPELKPRTVAVKLSYLKLPDLYYLWSICKDSPNFGKKFWWAINGKNGTQNQLKDGRNG